LIFFLLGYFMYASLFAAVGSAVGDDQGEAQSLTLPITIPVILAIYIMMTAVRAPDSSLAVWSSIFPLFSPIVMPARLPFGPPVWQVALSITLLVGTVIGLVWLAGRIYRVGILMYGKKVTFKELGKWLFYKE
jgi:ABC-2 type transport system permease protein